MKYFKFDSYEDKYTKHIPRYEDKVSYYSKNIVEVDIEEIELQAFIDNQNVNINITEITEAEFKSLVKDTIQMKRTKDVLREDIRKVKDFEDDLTDTKIILQNTLYLLSDIWVNVLSEEQKANAKYKPLMDSLAPVLLDDSTILRADLDASDKLLSILEDEKKFAQMSKDQYLDKIR